MAALLPRDVVSRLTAWSAALSLPEARWAFSSTPHVTVQFLGEVPPVRRGDAEDCLRGLSHFAFDAEVEGLGAFPDWTHPRVLWGGIGRGADAFTEISRSLERALRDRGFPLEDRAFIPHVTLARFRLPPRDLRGLAEAVRPALRAGFRVDRIALLESRSNAGGPRYVPLGERVLS